MPRFILQALEGRTIEQKRELIKRITDATVEVLGVTPDRVSIWIDEGKRENFARGGVLEIDR